MKRVVVEVREEEVNAAVGLYDRRNPPVLCMIFILLDIIILAAMTVNAISS